MSPKHQSIRTTSLFVNLENPRFDPVSGQREAIQTMVSDQGIKIYNLAKHIIDHGINPSELVIVTPLPDKPNCYKVLEGNRRITAIKLIKNPSLLPDQFAQIRKKIQILSTDLPSKIFEEIDCVVFANAEDANKWIKLKHTGQNEGVGVVDWDGQQVARFDDQEKGKSSIAMQALSFLENSKHSPANVKDNIKNIPVTNLDRIITDKRIQEVLGYKIVDGRIQSDLEEQELMKGFVKIANDLISKRIQVKHIYSVKDREQYIETFAKSEIPNKSKKLDSTWEIGIANPKREAKPQESESKRSIPSPLIRKAIIPKDFVIQIADPRCNLIYKELKRLDCEDFSNASAVLLRVFVELSSDYYLSKKPIQGITKDSKLSQKISQICDRLEKEKILDKHGLKGIRTALTSQHSPFAVDSFNAYVHNGNFFPTPQDLKLAWANYAIYIEAIWGNL